MSERAWDFEEVGRLPAPGDNVAMATRRLDPGTRVSREGSEFEIHHTVLEGHRFAVEPVAEATAKTQKVPQTRAGDASPVGTIRPA